MLKRSPAGSEPIDPAVLYRPLFSFIGRVEGQDMAFTTASRCRGSDPAVTTFPLHWVPVDLSDCEEQSLMSARWPAFAGMAR